MSKIKKLVYSLAVMIFAVVALSSCEDNENVKADIQKKGQLEKAIFISEGLDSLTLKSDSKYGVFLSFKNKETLKKYEDFLVKVLQNHAQKSLIEIYEKNGFSPLHSSQNQLLTKEGVYYDELSCLLLNKNCVIEVEGKIFIDKGNNFVYPRNGDTRSAPQKNQDSGSAGGCKVQQGYYSLLLKSKLKYSKPTWSDERVEIISDLVVNAPGGSYGDDGPIEHYYQCDLYLDGRSVKKQLRKMVKVL